MWIFAILLIGVGAAISFTRAPLEPLEGELGSRVAVLKYRRNVLAVTQHGQGFAWYLYKKADTLGTGGISDFPTDFQEPLEMFLEQIGQETEIKITISAPTGKIEASVFPGVMDEGPWGWQGEAELPGRDSISGFGSSTSRGLALLNLWNWMTGVLGFDGLAEPPEFEVEVEEVVEEVEIFPVPPLPGPAPFGELFEEPLPDAEIPVPVGPGGISPVPGPPPTGFVPLGIERFGIRVSMDCNHFKVLDFGIWMDAASPDTHAALEVQVTSAFDLGDAVFGSLLQCDTSDLVVGKKLFTVVAVKVQKTLDQFFGGTYLRISPPDHALAAELMNKRLTPSGWVGRYRGWAYIVRRTPDEPSKWVWMVWNGAQLLDSDSIAQGPANTVEHGKQLARTQIEQLQ